MTSKIIKLMERLNYNKISRAGVCFGLVHTMLYAHFKGSRNAMVDIHTKLVDLNDDAFEEMVEKLRKPIPESPSSHEDIENSDIRIFLDSVYLYHQGHEKEREFSSNPNAILRGINDLYIDVLLGEEKERTSRLYAHNKNDFIELLESIKNLEGCFGFEIKLTGHSNRGASS